MHPRLFTVEIIQKMSLRMRVKWSVTQKTKKNYSGSRIIKPDTFTHLMRDITPLSAMTFSTRRRKDLQVS